MGWTAESLDGPTLQVKVQAESGDLRKIDQGDGREQGTAGLVQPTDTGLCKIEDTGMTIFSNREAVFNLFIVLETRPSVLHAC